MQTYEDFRLASFNVAGHSPLSSLREAQAAGIIGGRQPFRQIDPPREELLARIADLSRTVCEQRDAREAAEQRIALLMVEHKGALDAQRGNFEGQLFRTEIRLEAKAEETIAGLKARVLSAEAGLRTSLATTTVMGCIALAACAAMIIRAGVF